MIPALRVDFTEVGRRCDELKSLLDEAAAARFEFEAGGERQSLVLDLRHREATASGGLLHRPGLAGNLPPGETYIVPYEGERPGDPSRSEGLLPLQLRDELLLYRIEANRVVEVIGEGPVAGSERREVAAEPAYANVAELGLGLLADYGVKPVGRILLDEKLGLHIAFGRSDHFGGQVGAKDFSSPDKVVHIDRVYIPEVQPAVRVLAVDLEKASGDRLPLMRDGRYVTAGR
jgi:leucyl aminopeptidase (aminopeptidase T)